MDWSNPVDVSNIPTALMAAIAGWRNRVVAGYSLQTTGNSEVYAAVSDNGGASFAAGVLCGVPGGGLRGTAPLQMAMDREGYLYVAWQDYKTGAHLLYFNRQAPDGTWLGPRRLSNFVANGVSVATDGHGGVYLCYAHEYTHLTDNQVEVIYSSDRGANWGAAVPLSNRHHWTDITAIAVDSGGGIHAVYERGTPGVFNLLARDFSGGVWQAEQTFYTGRAFWPQMRAGGDAVGLVWQKNEGTTIGVMYKRWRGGSWGGPVVVNSGAHSNCEYPAVALDASGKAYATFAVCPTASEFLLSYAEEQPDGTFSATTQLERNRSNAPQMWFTGGSIALAYQYDKSAHTWHVFARQKPVDDAGLAPLPFDDVAGNTFASAISRLYWMGAMDGATATTFNPGAAATRAEVARAIVVALGLTLVNPAHQTFTDVPPSSVDYQYIETAHAHAIISGSADGSFQPAQSITRVESAMEIVRARGYALINPPTSSFSDIPTSFFAYQQIETAHAKGLINAYPDGSFQPNQTIRRDEAANIVNKAINIP